jgi:hypothetical protein
MAITQQQVDDWFKANPNATPEQVAQTVQGLGGLAANNGLADLIGKQYGMSGANIGSIYDTLTYQPTMANSQPQQATPVTSTEQMQNNMAQQNKLQDYVDKIRATQPDYQKWLTSGDITSFAQRNQIDPNIAARFGKEYDFANSSQVRDAFSDPRTRSADVVYKLQGQGVSPEAIARYTGITPDRASEIYKNTTNDEQNFASAVKTGGINIGADTQYQRVPGGFVVNQPNRVPMMYDLMGKQIGRYDAPPPKGIAALAAKNPYLAKLFSAIKKD